MCPAVVSTSPCFGHNINTHNCDYSAIYKGTVNDPTSFPPPSKSHGSYHWAFERFLAAGLVPLTAAAFVTSGSSAPLLDGILGVSLVMHSHIGVRPSYSYIIRTVTNIFISSSMHAWWTTFTRASSRSWVPS